MILFAFLLFFFLSSPTYALERATPVNVQAAISDNSITIFGYTSPLSKVELTSTDTYALTYSDVTGFYEFKDTYLPKTYTDLCFTAKDDIGRPTSPVCIPPPPSTQYHNDIGPIILPPTIAINSQTISPNSTSESSGQTIPNSPVRIYLYQNEVNAPAFVPPVSAFSLPVFSTTSDSQGNFSFSLPTAYSSNYRLFASTEFEETLSPKSNTIQYNLPSVWYLFWLQHRLVIITLSLFILTLAFLVYLILQSRRPQSSAFLPAFYPKSLSLYPISKYINKNRTSFLPN